MQDLKKEQDAKNTQISELQVLVEQMQEKLEGKDDEVRIKNREISILKTEQEKLLKELRKLQEQAGDLKPYDTIPVPTPPNQFKRAMYTDDDDVLDIEFLKKAADDILHCDYQNPKSQTSCLIRPSASSSALLSSHSSTKSPKP